MFQLRDYQQGAIKAVKAAWTQDHPDTLVVLATGGGKTAVFLSLLHETLKPGQRALIIAHTKELVEQPRDRLISYYPEWDGKVGVVMAENDQCDAQITVATVQTLANEKRLARLLAAGPMDYLIIDEAHHAVADTYVTLYTRLKDANPALKHLGVTATPLRTDGAGLRAVYKHVAFKAGIRELVQAGWLVPPRWLAIQTGISLAGVATVYSDGGKDFSKKQLADVYETANCFELVVESHRKYADGRRALAFTTSVKGAYDLADEFNRQGIPAAAADGTTPKAERTNILNAFRKGEITVLCNMNLFTEGLDVPEVSCIHQVRPTKSDLVYTQIIGRALRPVPGKVDALILDYAPVEARNIVMAGDVLGVEAKKEVYLKETAEEGEVIGGFTFDGNVRWLNGSPMELISRSLDYLGASPWVWDKGEDGWLILPLGVGADQIERTLAMSPISDSMTLYLVGKRPDEQYPRAYKAREGTFEELTMFAEDYASKHGVLVLAQKAKAWRRQAPTEPQVRFATKLKVFKPGMSRGDVANAITRKLALRTLQHAGYIK